MKIAVLFFAIVLVVGAVLWMAADSKSKPGAVKKNGDTTNESIEKVVENLAPVATSTKENEPVPIKPAVADSNKPAVPAEPAVPAIKEEKPPVAKDPVPKQEENTVKNVPDKETDSIRFVVAIGGGDIEQVAENLEGQGLISDKTAFVKAFDAKGGENIEPGGYKLSTGINQSKIIETLGNKPYMEWAVIPEGLRKEEIAQLLTATLGWTQVKRDKWINTYTAMKFDYIEGVYFPDTYLIPVDEDPLKVAERFQAKFNEKFAVYLPEFNQQNIKWTTGLTFASIVQREAANKADMPLIAGILWNRLEANMALNVDATLQYVRGDTGKGWWAPLALADKKLESPYNTYLNKGLPPHPISNPGISAIEATLNPAKTDCLYYLHGKDHVTHCATTYAEHQENIEKYLKVD